MNKSLRIVEEVSQAALDSAQSAAQALVDHCEQMGIVLTIELRPDKRHLAMGSYLTEISVRPARGVTVK